MKKSGIIFLLKKPIEKILKLRKIFIYEKFLRKYIRCH